jgi:hypothetical protein
MYLYVPSPIGPEFVSWLTEELQADKTKHADSDDILKSMIYLMISWGLKNALKSVEICN